MPTTDTVLLERWITTGDGEALNELVARYAGLVHGACRRVLGDPHDAEDVAQECFLKLARLSTAPPRPTPSLAGWLHTVATRAAVGFLRSASRRKRRERQAARRRGETRTSARAPEDEVAWDKLQGLVDACIAELPEELHEVVVAHFIGRRTQAEIAATLGVSRQTVTYRVGKGIDKVRAALRTRGIAVPAGLAGILAAKLSEAAPPRFVSELGKLALSGATAVVRTHSTVSFSTLVTAGGVVMVKKTITSAAVALLLLLGGIAMFTDFLGGRRADETVRGRPVVEVNAAPTGQESAGSTPEDSARLAAAPEPTILAPTAVTGFVLDADGAAVPEARVAAVGPRSRKLLEVLTDDGGYFEIIPPADVESLSLWAFKTASGLVAVDGVTPGDRNLELPLDRLCRLSGRFYDRATGESIEGLTVRLSLFGPSPEVPVLVSARDVLGDIAIFGGEVRTDAEGRYTFDDLAPMRFHLGFARDQTEYVVPGYRGEDSFPQLALRPPAPHAPRGDDSLPRDGGTRARGRCGHLRRPP